MYDTKQHSYVCTGLKIKIYNTTSSHFIIYYYIIITTQHTHTLYSGHNGREKNNKVFQRPITQKDEKKKKWSKEEIQVKLKTQSQPHKLHGVVLIQTQINVRV